MATSHAAQALIHLEAARSAMEGLAELRRGEHSPQAVARFYDEIKQQTKLAEIEAQLSTTEAIERLPRRLSEGETVYRLDGSEVPC